MYCCCNLDSSSTYHNIVLSIEPSLEIAHNEAGPRSDQNLVLLFFNKRHLGDHEQQQQQQRGLHRPIKA